MSIINLRINLSKVDKKRLFKGEKGIYLDVVIAERKEPSEFGQTHACYISQSKEEREAKQDKIYVGDGKSVEFNDGKLKNEDLEDLPF